MEHLNKQERSSAFTKFLGVYILSLALPLVGCFLFLTVPGSSLKKENEALKATIEEQKNLLVKMDTLSTQALTLLRIDQEYGKASDDIAKATNKTLSEGQENAINGTLFSIKQDSAKLIAPANKQIAAHLLNTFNTLITYRNTIASQRDVLVSKNLDDGAIVDLSSKNKELEQKLSDREMKISLLEMSIKQAGGTGGGGGGGSGSGKTVVVPNDPAPRVVEKIVERPAVAAGGGNSAALAAKVEDMKAELAFMTADCDNLRADGGITNWSQRKQFYQKSLTTFQSIAENAPSDGLKQRANQKVAELTQKLARKGD